MSEEVFQVKPGYDVYCIRNMSTGDRQNKIKIIDVSFLAVTLLYD